MKVSLKNKKIEPLLKEFKNILIGIFDESLLHIIVFGSYLYGTEDAESDLDILVIINNYDDIKVYEDKLLDVSVDLSLKYDIVISAFLDTKNNYDKYQKVKSLYSEIHKNGVDICAA